LNNKSEEPKLSFSEMMQNPKLELNKDCQDPETMQVTVLVLIE
jgi:hypothetical protein